MEIFLAYTLFSAEGCPAYRSSPVFGEISDKVGRIPQGVNEPGKKETLC
jgi:hypothetical protein